MRTRVAAAILAAGVTLGGVGCGSDGPPKSGTGGAGQPEIEEAPGASGDPARKGKARPKPPDGKDAGKANVE
jgi:hypothetical protein